MNTSSAPLSRWALIVSVVSGLAWLASVLALDGAAGTLVEFWLYISGWLLLVAMAAVVPRPVRWQAAIALTFAFAVEVVFAARLGTYSYRRGPIAPYVVPGHGILFLTAWAASALPSTGNGRRLVAATAASAVGLGAVGLTSGRTDQLGAFWAVCMLGFLAWRRYAVLFSFVFWASLTLEYGGVALGAWTWAARDPVLGWVSIGNPPSVPGGGYCFFTAAGVGLVAWARRRVQTSTPTAPYTLAVSARTASTTGDVA